MSDEPGKLEPLIVIPGDLDQQRGYRVGKWRQHDNFECIYCQFATLWIERMHKHQLEGRHEWAYPGQNPSEDLSEAPDESDLTY